MGFTCGLMSEVITGQPSDVRGPVTNGNRQVNKPEGSMRLTWGLKRKVKGRYRSRKEWEERKMRQQTKNRGRKRRDRRREQATSRENENRQKDRGRQRMTE